MKISVVSTSRVAAVNLGDQLIAERCKAMVQDVAPNATVKDVFRADRWENVGSTIKSSDLVVICLAVRKDMLKASPFLPELIASDVPIAVVSAGLSLGAFAAREPLAKNLSEDDVSLIRRLSDKAVFFSSRGYLTQSLLAEHGIKSVFAGDVAFYEPRFARREFKHLEKVSRIAVSDPHYSTEYRESFLYLIKNLRKLFPEAEIDLLIHGINEPVFAMAKEAGVRAIDMHKHRGLSHYDDYDIHVGYRIHGHVSSLVRRMPSYLLEQDDRGIDYGATFSRRVSFASHRNISRKSLADGSRQVLTPPVDALMAVLRQDIDRGFSRFFGLEDEIEDCVNRNYSGLEKVVGSLATVTKVQPKGFMARMMARAGAT